MFLFSVICSYLLLTALDLKFLAFITVIPVFISLGIPNSSSGINHILFYGLPFLALVLFMYFGLKSLQHHHVLKVISFSTYFALFSSFKVCIHLPPTGLPLVLWSRTMSHIGGSLLFSLSDDGIIAASVIKSGVLLVQYLVALWYACSSASLGMGLM